MLIDRCDQTFCNFRFGKPCENRMIEENYKHLQVKVYAKQSLAIFWCVTDGYVEALSTLGLVFTRVILSLIVTQTIKV